METSTLVRKGYDSNCLHHDLEVLNNPVPPPSPTFELLLGICRAGRCLERVDTRVVFFLSSIGQKPLWSHVPFSVLAQTTPLTAR